MKPHTNHALVYIALTLAAVVWLTYLLSGAPYAPPSPPNLS
jgi:hypothetical protein